MIAPDALDALLDHLRRERVRLGASNVLLFGPAGDPFWAAWMPISARDVAILRDALDAIESAEAAQSRPFTGHDPAGRFTFGALADVELYVVLVMDAPQFGPAEARVGLFRSQFTEWLDGAPERRAAFTTLH